MLIGPPLGRFTLCNQNAVTDKIRSGKQSHKVNKLNVKLRKSLNTGRENMGFVKEPIHEKLGMYGSEA